MDIHEDDAVESDTALRVAWDERVEQCLAAARARHPDSVLDAADSRTTELTAPDWTGLPLRAERCLGRAAALALLDHPPGPDGSSGRDFQEEYLEWRVVCSPATGGVQRIELTTELADRWCLAAAHEPTALLSRVAAFAGEQSAPVSEVYGSYDPFADTATPAGRERAFADTMLGTGACSPYNDGRRAICCMTQPTNTLDALLTLAATASRPRRVRAPGARRDRAPIAGELLPLIADAAQAGRGSDPLLAERFARLAFEDRLVALAEPVGVWIQGVEHTRLRTPGGEPVPEDWFVFGRGLGSEHAPSGRPAHPQRLTLEVPAVEGFTVGDIVDVATEQRIRHGGQIAELVELAVSLRVGPQDSAGQAGASQLLTSLATAQRDDPEGCEELRCEEARLYTGSHAP